MRSQSVSPNQLANRMFLGTPLWIRICSSDTCSSQVDIRCSWEFSWSIDCGSDESPPHKLCSKCCRSSLETQRILAVFLWRKRMCQTPTAKNRQHTPSNPLFRWFADKRCSGVCGMSRIGGRTDSLCRNLCKCLLRKFYNFGPDMFGKMSPGTTKVRWSFLFSFDYKLEDFDRES